MPPFVHTAEVLTGGCPSSASDLCNAARVTRGFTCVIRWSKPNSKSSPGMPALAQNQRLFRECYPRRSIAARPLSFRGERRYASPEADSRQPTCWFRLGTVEHQEVRSGPHVGRAGPRCATSRFPTSTASAWWCMCVRATAGATGMYRLARRCSKSCAATGDG